jgi:hypothetical protein
MYLTLTIKNDATASKIFRLARDNESIEIVEIGGNPSKRTMRRYYAWAKRRERKGKVVRSPEDSGAYLDHSLEELDLD